MKPYYLENDDIQHQERLALVEWHSSRRGRKVPYKEILHNLQHEAFVALPKDFRQKFVC